MNQSAFLFVDGMPDDFVQTLPRLLDTVNRIGTHSGKLTCTWQVGVSRDEADAFCLGEAHTCGEVELLARPVITNMTGLNAQVVMVAYPLTAMAFLHALQTAEQLLQTAPKSTTQTIPKTVPPVAAELETPALQTPAAVPFFTRYLQDFAVQQEHVLTWPQDMAWISRTLGKVHTSCQDMAGLVALLTDTAVPQIAAYHEPPPEAVVFTYDALVWSYGLHAPLSEEALTRFGDAGSLFRLKKWPLFGQWETNAKLLLLTTLFTQKSTSVSEAVAKSGLDTEQVLHFLAAASMAQLPLEHELGDTGNHAADIAAKKDVKWINRLRKKLHMQDFLSD
ncbi:MAG: hypothetical protein Q4G42_02025 [Neisseria sp.]|nr:hypothetical protein [Neisseria sp.]